MTMTNEERAAQVSDSIEAVSRANGLDVSIDGDGPGTAAGDYVAAVLHWASQRGGDPKVAVQAAMNGLAHFLSETYDVDPEMADLDFFVEMKATAEKAGVEISYTTGAGGPTIDVDQEVNDEFHREFGLQP